MSLSSIPRSKARVFLLIGALLVALVLAVAPAAFAAPGGPSAHQQLESSVAAPESVDNYGTFNNPDYYYANITNAPDGTKYRQAGLSPDGKKIAAVKQVGTTPQAGWWEIVLMNADGTGETVISPGNSGTGDIYQYTNPFWSDDGTVIGFVEGPDGRAGKVIAYNVAAGTRSYIYEPTTTDVSNPDFLGASTTSIVFWDYGAGGNVADLFTWDGVDLINITNTADYKEYEPVSNADGTKIVYWSGESTAEPVDHTHTLTYAGGVWTKDVNFTPIAGTYWSYWTTPAATQIATTRIVNYNGTVDIELWDNTGVFVADLSGPGYTGGADHWNFFGSMPQGLHGEFVITSNSQRAVLNSGRDIIIAAPRSELFVATTGSDANPGTEAAPFKTIGKAITEATVGATIHVAAGTYAESVTIGKPLSLIGASSATTRINGVITLQAAASGTSGTPTLIKGFDINAGLAIDLGHGLQYARVEDCKLGGAGNAILARNPASVAHLQFVNLTFYGNVIDAYFDNDQQQTPPSTADDILFDGCVFSGTGKGIYAEKMSNLVVKNSTFTDVANGSHGYYGQAIDINLKGGNYTNITIQDNTFTNSGNGISGTGVGGSAIGIKARGTGDDTGYYPRPATLTNVTVTGNTFTGGQRGVRLGEPGKNNTGPTNVQIHNNQFIGIPTVPTGTGLPGAVVNTTTPLTNAENNWWGSACGPSGAGASPVSANVDYLPMWLTTDGSPIVSAPITSGMSASDQCAQINSAASGSTVTYGAGTYPGGVVVTANNVTIDLNGATVGYGSPAFTITADDVVLQNGILDGTGDPYGTSAVLVQGGADNFTLSKVEVKNWLDGLYVEETVTSLKVVNNYFHENEGSGLVVDQAPTAGSVVTIEGNLFKANGGNGVLYGGTGTLKAEYNSWGDVAGPNAANGDGALTNVDADPWTFAETYIDVDPTMTGDNFTRSVTESVPFDVEVRAEAKNVVGLAFKFSYDTTYLAFNPSTDLTWDAAFNNKCTALVGLSAGQVGYQCNLLSAWNGGPIATVKFTPTGTGWTPADGPWTTYLDVDDVATTAGTANGALVYLNNVKLAGVANDRDITDVVGDDGKIVITGIANFTGFIDVQGRADDSGAALEVHATNTVGSDLLAKATSAKGGAYTTVWEPSKLLTVGATYWFYVDKPLYVRTLVTPLSAPTAYGVSWTLTTRPLTTLAQLVLKGGDADNSEDVDIPDASCIGGAYGTTGPWPCGSNGGSSDVNGDGKVDILDLTLMGGNYGITASDWTH